MAEIIRLVTKKNVNSKNYSETKKIERKLIPSNLFYLNPGRPGGTRTLDPLIKSQLLCQLSYGPDYFCPQK
jgi:hypothetical protein